MRTCETVCDTIGGKSSSDVGDKGGEGDVEGGEGDVDEGGSSSSAGIS